jgi:cardiolipin synthase
MSPAPDNRLATLPNALSVVRIPLGGLFWVALAQGAQQGERPVGSSIASWAAPFGVLAAAGVSDVLDGWVARRRGVNPAGAGSWLDPICDKLFIGAVLAALYFQRHVPLAVLALIVSRELLQLPMVLVYRAIPTLRRWLRYDFRASWLGKGATVVQFVAVSALIIGVSEDAQWRFAFLAFIIGLMALVDYIRRAVAIGRSHLHEQETKQ